ncbi:MAG: S8 family serine peptidase [Candidatus Nanohaloarchaea archaeon]
MDIRTKRLAAVFFLIFFVTAAVASAPDPHSSHVEETGRDYLPGSYIVELNRPPLAVKPGKSQASKVGLEHRSFRANLERVPGSVRVTGEYAHAFNGYALKDVSEKQLERIRKLPQVESVSRNYRYEIQLADAKPMISVGQLWSEQVAGNNHTGFGVKVAVIDTGVAYNHSALGNCTTSEFTSGACEKVVAGYDFVNSDGDPMDDNGHGTHVAGIVAGNGSVNGVAPGAKLMAYKVLDSGGSGYTSDIINGVDQAVQDGADIISMSLGGPGNPDDSMSDAVKNAVSNGTVAVVAAGNSGDYYTIGSPGAEETAITVGAVDKDDSIASYSSRGPVTWNGNMITKPDVLAPGTNICSTSVDSGDGCATGYYTSKSGTSMATPVVSGSAALLLQSHPGWTPQDVKSALMGSAADRGYDAFTQGAGRINVSRADKVSILTSPAVVDFGNVTGTDYSSRVLEVQNNASSTAEVNLSATATTDFKSGRTAHPITFNVSRLVIPPGEASAVNISLNTTALNGTYYGSVELEDNLTVKANTVPYSFLITRELPVINSTYPENQAFVDATQLKASMTVKPFPGNTTAEVVVGGSNYTIWRDKNRSSGVVTVPLNSGNNTVLFRVYSATDPLKKDEKTVYTVSDTQNPSIDWHVQNATVLEPPSAFTVRTNASDNLGLEAARIMNNGTGSWLPYSKDLNASSLSCSSQWGADCSVRPGDGEIDNTYTSCGTGSGSYEHVKEVYVNASRVYVGQPVKLTASFHVFSSSDREYIWVRDDGWRLLKNVSKSGGDYNISTVYTPRERGDVLVRAMIDYSPEGDYCSSGSWYDNDDLKFYSAIRGKYIRGNLTANMTFDGKVPDFNDISYYAVNVTDRAGNYDSSLGVVKENKPPQLQNYSLENTSFVETSILEQNATAVFTVDATDPNGNLANLTLEYRGPSKTVQKSMANISTGYQVNLTTGNSGVEGNLTITATDELGDRASIERSFRVKEYVKPGLNVSSTRWAELLNGEKLVLNVTAEDDYNLSSLTLATNETGNWENKTAYGSPVQESGLNASTSFTWDNASSPQDVYWRVWTEDFFGNHNVSRTERFEVVAFNPDTSRVYAREKLGLAVQKPATIRVNRSDLSWSHTFHADETWEVLEPSYVQGFEAENLSTATDSNWSTGGDRNWSLSNVSFSGNTSVKAGNLSAGETSYLNFSFTPGSDRAFRFYYRVRPDGRMDFSINGASQFTDLYTDGWRREVYLLESGEAYNFSWRYTTDSDSGAAYLDNLSIGKPDPAGYAYFEPQNYGNYTLTIYRNDSGTIRGKHVETFLANTSRVPEPSLEPPGFPVEGRNFSLEFDLSGAGYNASTFGVHNSTSYIELSNTSKTVDNYSYHRTDEPVLEISLQANVSGLENGTYNLTVNITGKNAMEGSFKFNFTVFPARNLTLNVTNGSSPVGRTIGVFPGDDLTESLVGKWRVKGNETRVIPDLSPGNRSYSLIVLNNQTGEGARQLYSYWSYVNISLNHSLVETRYTENMESFDDKKLLVKSVQHYDEELDFFIGVYNASSLANPDDYTLYRCGKHTSSCESGWQQATLSGRDQYSGLLRLETEDTAEAYALGKPVEQQQETQPAPSFSGGAETEPEPVVYADNDSVKVENLYLENESLGLPVPENGLGIESVNFSGTVENGSAEFQLAEEDMGDFFIYTAFQLETSLPVETTLSVEESWLEERNLSMQEVGVYNPEGGIIAETLGPELQSGTYLVAAPEPLEMVTAGNPETGACESFEDDEVPDNWKLVKDCETWDDRRTAEQLIETVDEKVDSGKPQQLLQRAKQEYQDDNYSAAIENAQEANRIQKEQEGSLLGVFLAIVLVIFSLGVLGVGGFYGYHALRKRRMRKELSEVSEMVRQGMEAGSIPRDPLIARMVHNAEKKIAAGEYEKANRVLERLKNRIA